MPRLERTSSCPQATMALAAALGDVLREGDVVLFDGGLGSGKTTFIRALATSLHCDPQAVASPTFVMMNVYDAVPRRPDAPTRVVHVDAYRLHGAEDVDTLGWDTILHEGRAAPGSVLLVEWASRIADALPSSVSCARVELCATGVESRRVTLSLPDTWSSRAALSYLLEREPVRCRATGSWVSPTSPTYPFFDQRSRDADLYKWFSGSYSISRPMREDDSPRSGDAPAP